MRAVAYDGPEYYALLAAGWAVVRRYNIGRLQVAVMLNN